MIKILIITHEEISSGIIGCLEHIMGKNIQGVSVYPIKKNYDTDVVLEDLKIDIDLSLQTYEGILLLSDIYGATPNNIAKKLLCKGKVELVSGLNMSMLVKAVSYNESDIETCIYNALEGGRTGIVHLQGTCGCD